MELKFITQTVCSGCEALSAYLTNVHPGVVDEEINIDDDPSAVGKYDVMGTPTLILWDDEEIEEVDRMIGYVAGRDGVKVDELIEKL